MFLSAPHSIKKNNPPFKFKTSRCCCFTPTALLAKPVNP